MLNVSDLNFVGRLMAFYVDVERIYGMYGSFTEPVRTTVRSIITRLIHENHTDEEIWQQLSDFMYYL